MFAFQLPDTLILAAHHSHGKSTLVHFTKNTTCCVCNIQYEADKMNQFPVKDKQTWHI